MPSTGVGGILVQSAPPGYTDPHQTGVFAGLNLVASTPFAGVNLINGTQTLCSWVAPQDGNVHWCLPFAGCHVTVNETGGVISCNYVLPDGLSVGKTLLAGTITAGDNTAQINTLLLPVQAGSTVSITQSTALTAGAAIAWAALWAA